MEHTEDCKAYFCEGECKDGQVVRMARKIDTEQFQSND